ncbi:MAG: hypothetical protein JWL63_3207 [Rhodocyclales bacterium]|nr:hypothetical protein [Rhodocyclales bacterium]
MVAAIDIVDIEDAMLARVNAVNDGRLGYRIATLDTYGGEFDEDLPKVIRRFPGLWVVYAGSGKPEPINTARTKWRMPATFAVLVGAQTLRGEGATRRGLEAGGEVRQVGTYRMLRDVRRLFVAQDLGLAMRPFAPGAVKTLFNTRLNSQGLSVFSQEWHTSFIIDQVPDPCDAGWFDEVGINLHLTPDDGEADSKGIVSLSPT